MDRTGWAWLPLGLFSAAIIVVSHMPSPPMPPGEWNDKGLHFAAYGLYGLFAELAFRKGSSHWPSWMPFAWTALFGAVDEIHQSFVLGRFASPLDWVADLAGGAIACTFVALYFVARRA